MLGRTRKKHIKLNKLNLRRAAADLGIPEDTPNEARDALLVGAMVTSVTTISPAQRDAISLKGDD